MWREPSRGELRGKEPVTRRRLSRPRSACGRRARPRGGRCPPWAECPRGPAREGGREDRRRQGVATLREARRARVAGALRVGRKQWVPGPSGPGGLALTLSHQQPPFFQTKGVHPPGDEAWSCGTELSSAGRRLGPGWYVTGPARPGWRSPGLGEVRPRSAVRVVRSDGGGQVPPPAAAAPRPGAWTTLTLALFSRWQCSPLDLPCRFGASRSCELALPLLLPFPLSRFPFT